MNTPSTLPGSAGAAAGHANAASQIFQTAKHPTTCLLHIVFKLITVILFTVGPTLLFGGNDFVFTFVTTTVLLAVDFWFVKNIAGRLLVGLRWENHIEADGSTKWLYSSAQDEAAINSTDKIVFWSAIVIWPLLWSVLSFFYFIKLDWDWMTLTLMASVLAGANLLGYWKCSNESKRKLQQFTDSSLFKSTLSYATSFFF